MRHYFHAKMVCVIFVISLLLPVRTFAGLDIDLLKQAQTYQPAVLQDLEQLVNIDSPAEYIYGINQVQDVLIEKLQALGAEVKIVPSSKGANNVVAVFNGEGKGKILLMAHVDTVFKAGTVKKRPFRIEGNRAYGPGVVDDKGSVLTGLYAVKLLKDRGFQDFAKITYILNCDEEVGSPSSRNLIKELAKEHDYAICLEGGRADDGVIVWRKGVARLDVEVSGQAAHAGSVPQKGVNALMELVYQVDALSKLANPDKGTTVSFTVFRSGDRLNVIPDFALARADVRILYPEEAERIQIEAAEIIKTKWHPESSISVKFTMGHPPFPQNAKTDSIATRAQQIYSDLGLTLKKGGTGGVSDGNYAAAVATPTIDGLGFVGGESHTVNEYLEINSIPSRLYLLTSLIMEMGLLRL